MLALLGHLQSWRGLFLLLHFGASAVIFFCCCCSVTKFCLTLQPHELQHTRLPCPSLSPSLLKLIKPPSFSYAIQPSHPLSPLFLLPSIFLSIRVFSSEYTGLISFRIDWFDLLAIQGTLKSLLQHHSWKASILQRPAFFVVQLSHPYMTAGKTIPLTRWTYVRKVMSRLFNMLSRLVIAFLPRSKHLLISWLQSPSAVILEPKEIKSLTVFLVSPSICHEVLGPLAMILVVCILSFKPAFSLFSFTFIKSLFSSSSLSAIRVVSSAYLRLLLFLLAILIPACASSSLAFCKMYSAYRSNKQGDSIQP